MTPPLIIGIMLVKNEDLFIERAVRNTLDFCDRYFIADNLSTDRTFEIASQLATGSAGKIELVRVKDPAESHALIRDFAGTAAWIFAVDGDEIYDPAGLKKLREQIVVGAYDRSWTLFGNVLNVVSLDLDTRRASGYLAPPCRSMTKLFNFNAIHEWSGDCLERLHGGVIRFKPGFDENQRRSLHAEWPWDKSPFRCLHVCFVRRSSLADSGAIRSNVQERARWPVLTRLRAAARRLLGLPAATYKEEKYKRGELVTADVSPFFPARHDLDSF